MGLFEKVRERRESLRGQTESAIEYGILTLLVGDLEQDSINGKVYEKTFVPLTPDMERPEDKEAIATHNGVECLVVFVLVKDDSEITDAKVEGKVRAFVKSNRQSIELGSKQKEKLERENLVLEVYLPKQMTDEDIIREIEASGGKNIKEVMAHLKQFTGLYDGKTANKLVGQYLAGK